MADSMIHFTIVADRVILGAYWMIRHDTRGEVLAKKWVPAPAKERR